MVPCVAVALTRLTPRVNCVLLGRVVGGRVPCVKSHRSLVLFALCECEQRVVRVYCVVLIGQGVCTVRRVLMSELQRLLTRSAKHGRLSDMGPLVQACDLRTMVGWPIC